MRVTAPHFVAGAVWQRVSPELPRKLPYWKCVDAAPILGWMRPKSLEEVTSYLIKKGWGVEWLEPLSEVPRDLVQQTLF